MTLFIILTFIFGWMLVNTWLTLIFAELNGEFFAGWNDLWWLFISSLISPIMILLTLWVSEKIKRYRQ